MERIRKHCLKCPALRTPRVATGDSWEYVLGWVCTHSHIDSKDYSKYYNQHLGGKLIGFEEDNHAPEETPEWCPHNAVIEAKEKAAEDWKAETEEGSFHD